MAKKKRKTWKEWWDADLMEKKRGIPTSKQKFRSTMSNYSRREFRKLIFYWVLGLFVVAMAYMLLTRYTQIESWWVEGIAFFIIAFLLFFIGIVGFKDIQDKDMV